ncbi:hypothetical protein [Prauserella flavalba]|uniref:Uncharacterized protein n=1 Tax=Prauserella flavalba TaxID=1477506 RepID=A0A318LGI3_9PSEU|nr:hypothetical protein [Prauserella flavalba]PXY22060.1 hypothetical protein BA062_31535 [Prauserella flavalba]
MNDAATALDGIDTGDTVTVVATASGDTATAELVTEGRQQAGPGQGGPAQDGVPARRDDDGGSPSEE